jgi:p38 MAP kinase
MHECSSARDQIGHQFVAIKKISDPFGTASNAQNTFREIKLLKHLRHDNVRGPRSNLKG